MMDTNADIPLPTSPFLRQDGRISEVWWRFLLALFNRTGAQQGTDPGVLADGLHVLAPLFEDSAAQGLSLEMVPMPGTQGMAALAEMVMAPASGTGFAQALNSVAVTASPMTYTATARQALYVGSGAVNSLIHVRGGVSMPLRVLAAGQVIELDPGDAVVIDYTTAPTLAVIPR